MDDKALNKLANSAERIATCLEKVCEYAEKANKFQALGDLWKNISNMRSK